MASEKRRGGKKRTQKKKRRDENQEDAPLVLPFGDPRAMERVSQDLGRLLAEREFGSIEEANAFLNELLSQEGGLPPTLPPTTPLERAQDLVYEAFETESSRKRVQLAKKALKVSPIVPTPTCYLPKRAPRASKKPKTSTKKVYKPESERWEKRPSKRKRDTSGAS
jgi:hypothetical protein